MILSAEERELLYGVESRTLPDNGFHHLEHVRVAWLYLNMFPFWEAVRRFQNAIQSLAAAKGKATLYHETITFAYLALVNERIERQGRSSNWESFVKANGDLLEWHTSILSRYYTSETLQSEMARRVFIMPDQWIK
jgi:hypothetical protein